MEHVQTTACSTDWQERLDYHQRRADREQRSAALTNDETAVAAHLALAAHHAGLAKVAAQVLAMPDPEPPRAHDLAEVSRLINLSFALPS